MDKKNPQTRLNAFTPSCICNATAVAAQCRKVIFLIHSPGVNTKCAQKLFGGPSPHFGMTLETTFSPLSFGKSFTKIRSAVPENGCRVFFRRTEKNKKQKKNRKNGKKTSLKHIRIRLIGGCVNQTLQKTIPPSLGYFAGYLELKA